MADAIITRAPRDQRPRRRWAPRLFAVGWLVGLVPAVLLVVVAVDGNLQQEYRDEASGSLFWGEIATLFALGWIQISLAIGGVLVLARASWVVIGMLDRAVFTGEQSQSAPPRPPLGGADAGNTRDGE